jgi:hypothetical protein
MYFEYEKRRPFSALLGKTLTDVVVSDNKDMITFKTADEEFVMLHDQNCCEHVSIDDVAGEWSDVIGSPIVMAEEVSSEDRQSWQEGPEHDYDESFTWTFYKLGTVKGGVTVRWYGSSNGYYSESVDFYQSK